MAQAKASLTALGLIVLPSCIAKMHPVGTRVENGLRLNRSLNHLQRYCALENSLP